MVKKEDLLVVVFIELTIIIRQKDGLINTLKQLIKIMAVVLPNQLHWVDWDWIRLGFQIFIFIYLNVNKDFGMWGYCLLLVKDALNFSLVQKIVLLLNI